ncbi:MAG: peptidoglycan DL-endopeptidase CwlO [Frankiales bacterium]|nr:peptidoglycan DL-endopeptidase CwlO [Frankiales bacterium]
MPGRRSGLESGTPTRLRPGGSPLVPRSSRRTRMPIAGLLLSALLAVLVPSGSAHADRPDVPNKSDLAALRAEADRSAAALAAGTAALEKVQANASTLAKKAAAASRRSATLDAQLSRLHREMGAFAAAAYRNPVGSKAGLLFGQSGTAAGNTLQGLGYLDVVSARRAEVLRSTAATRLRAEQARREMRQLSKQAAEATQEADRRVAALRREATAVGARLTVAMAAYEAEQERLRLAAAAKARAARAARLAVRQTGSCAGGGGREWGGYPNGFIPASALSPLSHAPGQRLRCDAAAAFGRLTAAYAAAHGGSWICVTDSYRSYADQQRLYQSKPSLAAVPGTSNHGWALALDLCGGAQRAGSDADAWLHAHAAGFGWHHPGWAEPSGSRPEAWHWEFGYIS